MNIIVTGTSRGIGFEIVKQLSNNSDNKIVAIARNDSKLRDLKKSCLEENPHANIYPIAFDLENMDLFEIRLLADIQNHIKNIDILINNAGLLINKPFEELSEDEINRMIQLNLTAPAILIKTLLPLMNESGHIVNISSMGGFQGSQKFPGLAIYSAAKAGLASLTECLAEEYKNSGLAFNCLALGSTDTEMLREAFPGYQASFKASEMASFILDFALNKYKFFNGKIIPVSKATP
jgi:short-subunit dehydrogenase